ncbi:BRO-N domain-containing protein [Methylocystis sp.]|uniref:BRO-N domain-containing protein n=1 Tax=Methylocystis sp. TaxID=1911079 RepID=UPI003D137973
MGIANSRDAVEKLDDDERMTVALTDSHSGQRGGAQSIQVITESGLYALVLRCRDAMTPGSTATSMSPRFLGG